jgi:diguanylate cyclase (GGDEF)-like protein
MMACLRPCDLFFRYGGEEFLLCAPGIDVEAGIIMVERLRDVVSKLEFIEDEAPPFRITVSIGLTLIDPDAPIEHSIERASNAMSAAKRAGGNQTKKWDETLGSHVPVQNLPGEN